MTIVMLLVLIALISLLNLIGARIQKKFSAIQRKWLTIIHIITVIIYFGGVLATLMLTLITTTEFCSAGEQIYAAHLFAKYSDWFLIIPGGLGSLLTGVWLAARGQGGVTKYYWVLVKTLVLIGSILYGATFIRISFEETVRLSQFLVNAPVYDPAYLHSRWMMLINTYIALASLLFMLIISYLRPWGKRRATKKWKT